MTESEFREVFEHNFVVNRADKTVARYGIVFGRLERHPRGDSVVQVSAARDTPLPEFGYRLSQLTSDGDDISIETPE